jgi:putative Mg2+ transporter-C (MgtC) family protein
LDVDWPLVWGQAWRLLLAFALALPIGWERERSDHSAGLRTFPLVAVGACGFLLTGLTLFFDQNAQSRVVYGIITGIGFIGGGAILKNKETVHGTATAASLWNTAAIGVAVGGSQFSIAVLLTVLNIAVLRIKRRPPADAELRSEET